MIRDSRIWNSVIVGKPVIESIDVDINSQSLRLQVDMISILPDSLHKALDGRRQITIWGKDIMLAGFPDELVTSSHFRQYEINENRKSRAREFLKSRLLSFTVEAVKKDTQRVYFNGKNVAFHDTPITFNLFTSQFTPIPIIAKDVPAERVQKILYEKFPSIDFLSYQYPEDPPLIVGYRDYFFGCESGWLGELKQHWRIYCPENEEMTCVQAELPESQILRRGNLAFLLDEDLNEISNRLLSEKPFPANEFLSRFSVSSQVVPISENRSQSLSLPQVEDELNAEAVGSKLAGGITQPSGKQENKVLNFEAQEVADSGEQTFINDLNQVALANQLVYDMEDLVNFHIAIKTGALVVLAGMSGVGKSQLVINYARALGLSGVDEAGEERKQFLFIPVRPHWNDDADLIGFYDAVHKIYRPAETGLVDLLIEASKEDNKDKLYLICFDEMNLARVEHYFSQFLSILELSEDRYLTLYSEKLAPEVYNRHEYPSRVPIGNNVFFVGTVNIDESSFQFSDKVLDRANVIKLKIYESLRAWKVMFEEKALGKTSGKPSEERAQLSPVPGKVFASWCNNSPTEIGLTDNEMDFLDELNSALRKIDKDRVVGYRVIRQIGSYLKNIPCTSEGQRLLDRGKALDLQLVQRIMTKIKGPECDLERLFGKYMEREQAASQMLQLFDKHQAVSTFSYSRDVCHKKAKDLLDHGYSS